MFFMPLSVEEIQRKEKETKEGQKEEGESFHRLFQYNNTVDYFAVEKENR